MKEDLLKLVELQKSDTEFRQLKQAVETAQKRRAEIEQEFDKHAFSIREIQDANAGLHAEKADIDKHISENRTYLERAERNLKNAQNQKEYEAANREREALKLQISEFEKALVEKVAAIDEKEGILAERADEINSLDADREKALADFDAKLAEDKASMAETQKEREAVFATLPQQLARAYDRLALRSKDGIAVAEVVNGSCSACFMSLRPQMQVNVKRGDAIIMCESCSRILYMADRTEATSAN